MVSVTRAALGPDGHRPAACRSISKRKRGLSVETLFDGVAGDHGE